MMNTLAGDAKFRTRIRGRERQGTEEQQDVDLETQQIPSSVSLCVKSQYGAVLFVHVLPHGTVLRDMVRCAVKSLHLR